MDPMVLFLFWTGRQAHEVPPLELPRLPRDRDGPQDRLNILLPAGLAVADILRRGRAKFQWRPRNGREVRQKCNEDVVRMLEKCGKLGKKWNTFGTVCEKLGKRTEKTWGERGKPAK